MKKSIGELSERGTNGKNVPKLGPDGKVITFPYLVMEAGDLHRDEGETDAAYAGRLDVLIKQIDDFYAYWNGRMEPGSEVRVDGPEGLITYAGNLIARAEVEPEKESNIQKNRIAAASYFIDKDVVLYKTKLGLGQKGYNKWLDEEIKHRGTTIPGVVVG